MLTGLAAVRDVLAQKRIALIGVSRSDRDFSRYIFRELRNRGYDVVPVNRRADSIDGAPCFPTIADVQPSVDAAIVMTSRATAEGVVRDCDAAGVKRIWLSRGVKSPSALDYCHARDITCVYGECPMMFLPEGEWFHSLHKAVRILTRTYPV
jgi:predicted CoA-binding protein